MRFWIQLCCCCISVFWWTSNISAAPHWSHEEQEHWGEIEDIGKPIPLNYPFADCGIGRHQSPIDLSGALFDKKINKLKPMYPVDTLVFYNTGHAIQVNTLIDYPGYLKIGKERYPLIQFHFHAPSEHVIDSQTFVAELHFVHVRDDGRMAVLGVLIEEGRENLVLQIILDNMPVEHETENAHSQVVFSPAALLPDDHKHVFTYAGSLTTPPCSEGINWYVLTEPITASESQIMALESFYSGNIRNVQHLNGRTVIINDK